MKILKYFQIYLGAKWHLLCLKLIMAGFNIYDWISQYKPILHASGHVWSAYWIVVTLTCHSDSSVHFSDEFFQRPFFLLQRILLHAIAYGLVYAAVFGGVRFMPQCSVGLGLCLHLYTCSCRSVRLWRSRSSVWGMEQWAGSLSGSMTSDIQEQCSRAGEQLRVFSATHGS